MPRPETTALLTRKCQMIEAPPESSSEFVWARCVHECGIETDGYGYAEDAEVAFCGLAMGCRKCCVDPAALSGSPAPDNLWPEELACLLRLHKDRERQDRAAGYVAAGNMEAARADQIREIMNAKRS